MKNIVFSTALHLRGVKRKRWAAIGIAIWLLTVAAPRAAQQGDFTYTDNGAGITITGYTGACGAVVIPATIDGKVVTSVGKLAFSGPINLTSVAIPNGVTTIGPEAFSHCPRLTSVTIPTSVTFIGDGAFAFSFSLTNVTLPSGLSSIGDYTFQGCTGLTSVTIGDSVRDIGQGAFAGCSGLSSVSVPNSVATIGAEAFGACASLTTVTIPNGVSAIGFRAFAGCIGLSSISVDLLNSTYSSLDGVLFNKGQTTLTQYPAGKIGGYTIPHSVTFIGDSAFSDCSGLTSVTIPNSVSEIGLAAFAGCFGLRSLYFLGNRPGLGSLGGSRRGDPHPIVYYREGAAGWEASFDGRSTALWIEAEDLDYDGLNNLEEMMAGTDPLDATSLLAFEGAPRPEALVEADKTAVPPGQHALYFKSLPGMRYEILWSESLDREWSSVATVSATTFQKRVLVGKPTGAAFYRVRVLP